MACSMASPAISSCASSRLHLHHGPSAWLHWPQTKLSDGFWALHHRLWFTLHMLLDAARLAQWGCPLPCRRGYTHGRYRRIIDSIRRHMPNASISGDAIVGFPGETEEQFEATVQLVRDVGFDRVNTAAYSPRPNTPAAEWEHQVGNMSCLYRQLSSCVGLFWVMLIAVEPPESWCNTAACGQQADALHGCLGCLAGSAQPKPQLNKHSGLQVADLVKADRLNRLNRVVNEVAEERAQRFLGATLEVLVEGPNPKDAAQLMGRSEHNKLVFCDGDGFAMKGSLVNVKIDTVHAFSLFGQLAA